MALACKAVRPSTYRIGAPTVSLMVLRARHIMTVVLISVSPDTPIKQAWSLIASYRFSALPVVDARGRLVGMVSGADLLHHAALRGTHQGMTVSAVMNTEPLHVDPYTQVSIVRHRMHRYHVRAMPVVDHGALVGLVTRGDLLRRSASGCAVVRYLRRVFVRAGDQASRHLPDDRFDERFDRHFLEETSGHSAEIDEGAATAIGGFALLHVAVAADLAELQRFESSDDLTSDSTSRHESDAPGRTVEKAAFGEGGLVEVIGEAATRITWRAQDVMTRRVARVAETTPVAEAAELMTRCRFSALPVVDNRERVVGLVSEDDIIRDRLDGRRGLPFSTVGEAMTTDVVTVSADTSVTELGRLLSDEGLRVVPVVDGARLVGVVSRIDLLDPLGGEPVRERLEASVKKIRDAIGSAIDAARHSADGAAEAIRGAEHATGEWLERTAELEHHLLPNPAVASSQEYLARANEIVGRAEQVIRSGNTRSPSNNPVSSPEGSARAGNESPPPGDGTGPPTRGGPLPGPNPKVHEVVNTLIDRAACAGTATSSGLADSALGWAALALLDDVICLLPGGAGSAVTSAHTAVSRLVGPVLERAVALTARFTSTNPTAVALLRDLVPAVAECATEQAVNESLRSLFSACRVEFEAADALDSTNQEERSRRAERLNQLERRNGELVGPVQFIGRHAVPSLARLPAPGGPLASAIAGVVLLAWILLVTGDQLDAHGYPRIWPGVVSVSRGES